MLSSRDCVLAASCAALSTVSSAHAATDEVVVTATRAESPLSRITDTITVISAEQVRDSQKLAISDLLATIPGVAVNRNGGLGKQTSLRIRGAESEHTVALIDGVKLNDFSSPGGGFDFADLLANEIARIEVLRGAQSVLWGSQAIGGVVNIITPVPEGPLSAAIGGELGSYATAQINARVQSGDDRFAWRVGGNYLATDGVSSFDEDLGGREDDGYRNIGAHGRALWYVNEDITAELRSYWWRGRSDLDGFPLPRFVLADTREYGVTSEHVGYAGLNVNAPGGKLKHRIGVAYTDMDRTNKNPDSIVATTFDAEGGNLRFEYQGILRFSDTVDTVFGIEREKSSFGTVSPTPSDPDPNPLRNDIRLDSIYGLVQFVPLKALTLSGGMRYDDHATFGGSTTTQAGVAWAASPSTLLRASYGEGFKAPTLYQLYSEYGTPGLEPEESQDWDVGVEQRIADVLVVSVTYFDRDTAGMIDFVSCFGNGTAQCVLQPSGYYENVQKATAEGFEASLTAQITKRLQFDVNYTRLDARNATPGTSFGKDLRRRARESAYAQLHYRWPISLTTTIAAQHVGRSFDDVANSVPVADYTVVDLRAAHQFSDRLEIYGRLENAFDENYQTTYRYGTLRRGVYAGFRMDF